MSSTSAACGGRRWSRLKQAPTRWRSIEQGPRFTPSCRKRIALQYLSIPFDTVSSEMARRMIMRTFTAVLVLAGHCFVSHTAAQAQSQNCKKLCRDDYSACVKAHTQGACKTNYD